MAAIKVHHTETSEGGWDGPANEARLKLDGTESYYRQAFAWQDPEGDSTTKAAYRFIHHEVSGDGSIGAANLRACSTGIGVLNGGRGGTTIPDSDRQGVWSHLAAHLRDADMEPPELKSASPDEREVRSYLVEMRIEREEGKPPVIEGHAAVFDSWSVDLGGFKERIRPGAFGEALLTSDARALFNHDPNYVLGRQSSQTLSLAEDKKGLKFRVIPPRTTWADDLLVSIERGDVREGSFSFVVAKGGDRWNTVDGNLQRDLLTIRELYDVSIVTFPAYPQTSAQVRARVEEELEKTSQEDEPGGSPKSRKIRRILRKLDLLMRS